MIQAVICDLDETLLDDEKNVSAKDLETIHKIRKQGIHFIPATGRPFYSLKQTLKDLDLYQEQDLTISYNGGMIHQNHNLKPLILHHLNHGLVSFLFDFGQKENVTMHVYVEDLTYTFNMNDEERHHCRNFPGFKENKETSLDFLKGTPILKILFQNLDLDYLRHLEQKLPQKIKDQLEISYSSNRYLEFNPKGISKGMAVQEVSKTLNIPIENILTIGDNLNDLSMIQISGKSAAPKNAVEQIKKSADYISPYTYNESCITDIIKHFINF